jgi:hypothetical protein
MHNKLERKWNEAWPNLKYYARICLEDLRKAMKTPTQYGWSLDEDLSPGPSEYKARVVANHLALMIGGSLENFMNASWK